MNNFNIQQNQLLGQWQNMQKQNPNYQNNILLQNNKYIQQATQNRVKQMQYIQHMQQLRKMQLMQQMQNRVKQYTKNLLEPITIKEDNRKIKENYEKLDNAREKEKEEDKIIDNKTGKELKIDNTPYKQIMTKKEFGGDDYKKKHKKKTFTKEILVHKVDEQDKDVDIFEEQLNERKKKVKKHNKKLKKIYADERKEEHFKKFEYRRTYIERQYCSGDNTSSKHSEMKKGRLKAYEKQQKEWEKDNIKVSNLVQNLKNKGILTDDQVNATMGMIEGEIN